MPNPVKLQDVTSVLVEAPTQYMPTKVFTRYHADYYVVTPKGSRTRFTQGGPLTANFGAHSETAILSLLRKRHPGTDILINDLRFE